MSTCKFENLLQLVNNQLDPDKQLEVYTHLDRCEICRDSVFQISRDLNRLLFFYCAQCANNHASQRPTGTAWSGLAQMRAKTLARPAMRRGSNHPH